MSVDVYGRGGEVVWWGGVEEVELGDMRGEKRCEVRKKLAVEDVVGFDILGDCAGQGLRKGGFALWEKISALMRVWMMIK